MRRFSTESVGCRPLRRYLLLVVVVLVVRDEEIIGCVIDVVLADVVWPMLDSMTVVIPALAVSSMVLFDCVVDSGALGVELI